MYKFLVYIITFVFYLFNGKPQVVGKENLPNSPAIYAITHRSAFDPFYIAMICHPKEIAFMAKESLFQNPILAKILKSGNVFPVNRENPSPKVIKHAAKTITQKHINLGIFPSGSRYKTEIKSGTSLIQKLSKSDIIPITIQPPLTLSQFFARKKAKIAIGQPIKYIDAVKYDREYLEKVDLQLVKMFNQLDSELDSSFTYTPKQK